MIYFRFQSLFSCQFPLMVLDHFLMNRLIELTVLWFYENLVVYFDRIVNMSNGVWISVEFELPFSFITCRQLLCRDQTWRSISSLWDILLVIEVVSTFLLICLSHYSLFYPWFTTGIFKRMFLFDLLKLFDFFYLNHIFYTINGDWNYFLTCFLLFFLVWGDLEFNLSVWMGFYLFVLLLWNHLACEEM